MSRAIVELSLEEKRFRLWMRLSFYMYALGAPFFLLLGRQIAAFLNGLPGSALQGPPWPLAGEGMEVRFWQVLGVSLMAMLAILCQYIARDVRRYGPLTKALLAAKLVSTLCYAVFFAVGGNIAFLVATVTDGLIFLISWTLWHLAEPAGRFLDDLETRILVSVGEALLPQGGAFEGGYADERDRCLEEARRLLSTQSSIEVVMTRCMLRLLDVLPFFLGWFGRFHRLAAGKRILVLERLESCPISPLRMMALALKLYIVIPFFNAPDAASSERK